MRFFKTQNKTLINCWGGHLREQVPFLFLGKMSTIKDY